MALFKMLLLKAGNALLLLLAVIILNFFLVHAAPGDPAEVIAGEMGGATPELLADIRRQYGLDKPLVDQLELYLGKMLTGDLGFSFYFNQPVTKLILQRIPATMLLVITALLGAIVTGMILGIVSALNPRGIFNNLVSCFSLFGYAAPIFWTAIMLILIFSSYFSVFPVNGMYDVANQKTGIAYIFDVLHHLVLPSAALALLNAAQYSRLSRASMIETLHLDYIRTARAKGLSEYDVIFKHALRNTLIPILTMAGLQFGHVFAGSILIETVFSWPGLGRLVFESILRRDYPTLLGILFFSALLVMAANILTDLTYRIIDPRVRKEAK